MLMHVAYCDTSQHRPRFLINLLSQHSEFQLHLRQSSDIIQNALWTYQNVAKFLFPRRVKHNSLHYLNDITDHTVEIREHYTVIISSICVIGLSQQQNHIALNNDPCRSAYYNSHSPFVHRLAAFEKLYKTAD